MTEPVPVILDDGDGKHPSRVQATNSDRRFLATLVLVAVSLIVGTNCIIAWKHPDMSGAIASFAIETRAQFDAIKSDMKLIMEKQDQLSKAKAAESNR